MRLPSVFLRGTELFIIPASQTMAGIWIDTGPIMKLRASASAAAKGQTVMAALSQSTQGIPDPIDPNKPFGPSILAEVGARSAADFEKGTKLVNVKLDN